MRADEAAQIISQLRTKPGWKLNASSGYYYRPGQQVVLIEVVVRTVDTSNTSREITVAPVFPLDVSSVEDVPGLTALVLEGVMAVENHEWREFLALPTGPGGTYVAPLHPHTHDGQDAWQRYRYQAKQQFTAVRGNKEISA